VRVGACRVRLGAPYKHHTLRKSAETSANSGKDLYLGHGRVNAYRAVLGE